MMNRRTLLAAVPALAGAASLTAEADAAMLEERPPFDITPDGDAWRIRSWEWAEDAWRPMIAEARMLADRVRIKGPVAPADRGAIHLCIGRYRL
ncbi:hypothetical protein NPJ82_14715 [Sphingomonas sp. NY01]|uniref:hypothetical protein n=1 Tax=Sphingomonas sp. NY01 TaxID=2968057 RepID=UPI00315CDA1C